MIQIANYLNDGANYQCQMILCYLRMKEYGLEGMCRFGEGDDYLFSKNFIIVGRFENCREQGYVFGVRARNWFDLDDKWMVVEHRSSDSIKIRHFRTISINTPSIDRCYNDDTLVEEKWFDAEDIIKASNYIYNGMVNAIKDFMDGEMYAKQKEKYEEKFGKNNK